MAIKSKKHEKLDEVNIDRVIGHLLSDTPITKKEACEMLNISYNTARLSKIIEEHEDALAFRATRKAFNKGKKATDLEIKTVVQDYLSGDPVSDIAKRLYRSSTFVNSIIERVGVPQKRPKTEQQNSALLPDECVSESFEPGEKVWSAKHDLPARVVKQLTKNTNYNEKYGSNCYQIHVIELTNFESPYFGFIKEGGFNAAALAYDIGKLTHLQKYGAEI